MKRIAILGSTGSIGTQTLEIVREKDDLTVAALAAGKNVVLLEKQIREFHPKMVAVWEKDDAEDLSVRLGDMNVDIVYGMDGLIAVAEHEDSDMLVTAIVGMLGIRPTIAAINAGKDIALANKETLVTAGHIIMPLAKEKKVKILPVDSEHSAVFQSLHGEDGNKIEKIILTASGGPFRGKKRSDLKEVRLEDALKHPNWSMGRKITIDSATLANKGLEVMEARWLFNTPLEKIQVVIHPQSVIHSMVQFEDGAVMAQLGVPDMKTPIQYALYYPERRYLKGDRLNLFALSQMTFEAPDTDTFQCLKMAFEAMKRGGNMPTVFNAANERAVALFLKRKIDFLDIPEIIQAALETQKQIHSPSVNDILETEKAVYEFISSRYKEI